MSENYAFLFGCGLWDSLSWFGLLVVTISLYLYTKFDALPINIHGDINQDSWKLVKIRLIYVRLRIMHKYHSWDSNTALVHRINCMRLWNCEYAADCTRSGIASSVSSLEFKSKCWWRRVDHTWGVWRKWPAMRRRAQVCCINHALTSWTISVPLDIFRARGMELLVFFECQLRGVSFMIFASY